MLRSSDGVNDERICPLEDRESGDLLEEVGALLSEVQDMQSHVSSLACSGEGFSMEEKYDGSGTLQKTSSPFEKQLEVEEVMMDEIYQYQVRSVSTVAQASVPEKRSYLYVVLYFFSTSEQMGRLWMSQTRRAPSFLEMIGSSTDTRKM